MKYLIYTDLGSYIAYVCDTHYRMNEKVYPATIGDRKQAIHFKTKKEAEERIKLFNTHLKWEIMEVKD